MARGGSASVHDIIFHSIRQHYLLQWGEWACGLCFIVSILNKTHDSGVWIRAERMYCPPPFPRTPPPLQGGHQLLKEDIKDLMLIHFKKLFSRPFACEESWHRRAGGSSLCPFPGSPDVPKAPQTDSLNANGAGLVGHMQVGTEKGEGVLQGACNQLVSLNSAGHLICIEQRFHYSCASPRDCMVMKPRHSGPELCRPREAGGQRPGARATELLLPLLWPPPLPPLLQPAKTQC